MYDRTDFKWIVFGGVILSFHAGFINSIGMKSAYGYTVTHITGLYTRTFFGLVDRSPINSVNAFMVLIGFVLGAFFTGLICGSTRFRLQPRYGVVILIESLLLFISVGVFHSEGYPNDSARFGFFFVSMGVAMQNSMFSTFSGAVVRTTHLTGIINDTAMLVGQYIRYRFVSKKKSTEMWKLLVFVPLLVGFAIGVLVGASAFNHMSGFYALLIPATSLGLIASTFLIGSKFYFAIKDKRDLESQTIEASLEEGPKIVPLEQMDDDQDNIQDSDINAQNGEEEEEFKNKF